MNRVAVVFVTALVGLVFALTSACKTNAGQDAYPVGSKIANFALPDDKGNTVRLSQYAGKVMVLCFYASW